MFCSAFKLISVSSSVSKGVTFVPPTYPLMAMPCSLGRAGIAAALSPHIRQLGGMKLQSIKNFMSAICLLMSFAAASAFLRIMSTKGNFVRHLKATPKCLKMHQKLFPFGMPPCAEVAAGDEMYRLSFVEPLQALGPLIVNSWHCCFPPAARICRALHRDRG